MGPASPCPPQSRRSPVVLLCLVSFTALLPVVGCGATTGVDVEIVGAEALGGDQVRIEGGIEGQTAHTSTVPSSARALAHVEDLRIIVPDSMAGQILSVTGTVLKKGQPVGSPVTMDGKALLVAEKTKRVKLCFDPAGCP